MVSSSLLSFLFLLVPVVAFTSPPTTTNHVVAQSTCPSTTTLFWNSDFNGDFMRRQRESRNADGDDNVVELRRPLGLILKEDKDGNVYVETIAPKGNAARAGGVKEGDVVTMCSATFGNDMWSTRGVGLTRVLAAIRVRAGNTVKLALESPNQTQQKARRVEASSKAAEAARLKAQEKKDRLLTELESDEQKLKKGKFFGLF
mmetsp:Transcript_26076/g.38566  ORF Transcript_26076/g.38566 Transcript_26076/m.38566 type:complete len:202 (+) Transcript_26076:143-748(+)|eukprot:CAMPEP_0194211078 /NCGR_PEP_ID=MMETSP0156-20130528/9291_1 /TAXON_ID=33649 /ORGANISM="Thalassionema nitzschioides, Strain L26-B" /LENGTH=201 /DNA_ID=CAMNT_0038938509 /DNA_START=132 /DNA_END=737 /DNA_ORIENTATION=-